MPSIITETERLVIRDWKKEDFAPFAKMVADPEVMKYIGEGNPWTSEYAETYLKNCMLGIELCGWARFAVEYKQTGELAGFCGYAIQMGHLDFGWRYARSFWNKGIGTEAAKVVLELGIHTFKFPRIVALAFSENAGSIRIMQKIGMTFEKKTELFGKEVAVYVSEQ